MVHLQKLHEKYGQEGLFVFAISMHPEPEQARALTKELGVTYTVFDGRGSDLGDRYAFG
jgi:hypothetical protein